jgi:predicted XRE-type DNA-binding protein
LRRIKVIIEESGMTQSQAARVLGIDQPRVSKLMNGKLSVFSMDRLIHFLNALDRDVEIVVKPKGKEHGCVLVTLA